MKKGSRKASGLVIVLVALCLSGSGASAASDSTKYLNDPGKLPAGLYPALVKALQSDAPAGYEVMRRDASTPGAPLAATVYRAPNPAHGFVIDFGAEGIALGPREAKAWRLGMVLLGYGYGEDIRPVPPARVHVDGNRVEYRRGGRSDGSPPALTEWYLNGPLGLEQGFTLAAPPPGDGKRRGDLVLVLALSGGLEPVLGGSGQAIRLTDSDGRAVLRYGGLYAHDAKGRRLPARLALANNRLSIHVDDAAALYPITIDPLIARETKLTASDAALGDEFGVSVAVSGDTVVVGAWKDDFADRAETGSAYVFVKNGGTWSQQAKLTDSLGGIADGRFGTSLAIDGDTVVVMGKLNAAAHANVFVRSGTSWTLQQKFFAGENTGTGIGVSVAISGDTLVVGAHLSDELGPDFPNSGSAFVFLRSGTTWTQEAKLTASDPTTLDQFGISVAISGDTVVVGSFLNLIAAGRAGAAYVFQRSGTIWTQEAKLTASDAALGAEFGISVGISGDTVVARARRNVDFTTPCACGAAYVFQRSGTIWTQEAKLTASDAAAGDEFGFGNSVAISGDTVVVGADLNDDAGANSGSAYVFQRSGTTWSQRAKLTASDAALGDNFGFSVAISVDTAVVGAPFDDHAAGANAGSAYVYELFKAKNDVVVDFGPAVGLWALMNNTLPFVG